MALALAGVFTPQHSLALSTISTSEIQPGMKGYGLTVFSGSEPERFEVEVVEVKAKYSKARVTSGSGMTAGSAVR